MHQQYVSFTGFIKFLGPYYMLIITEQRKIGDIFGHPVYQVTKTAMIELSNSKTRPKLINSKDENRCCMTAHHVYIVNILSFILSYTDT